MITRRTLLKALPILGGLGLIPKANPQTLTNRPIQSLNSVITCEYKGEKWISGYQRLFLKTCDIVLDVSVGKNYKIWVGEEEFIVKLVQATTLTWTAVSSAASVSPNEDIGYLFISYTDSFHQMTDQKQTWAGAGSSGEIRIKG